MFIGSLLDMEIRTGLDEMEGWRCDLLPCVGQTLTLGESGLCGGMLWLCCVVLGCRRCVTGIARGLRQPNSQLPARRDF